LSVAPINKIQLGKDFENKTLAYKRLIGEVKAIIRKKLADEPINIFNLEYRQKKFDSFYKKIIRKNFESDFFNKIEDIAGVRIICEYYAELDLIEKCIDKMFNVIKKEKKITALKVNEFGYLSDHYIIKLRKEITKETEKDLLDLKCEIQVRTILMHSWAVVSHDIDYKKEESLPEDLKKEMYAISGLLYIADQRFNSFKDALTHELQKKKKVISPSIPLDQNISAEKLIEYLQWKFTERSIGKIRDYGKFSEELTNMNYTTIEDVDKMITKASEILLVYEKKHPPNSIPKSQYDRVGSARICIGIVDTQNKKSENFYVIDLLAFRNMLDD